MSKVSHLPKNVPNKMIPFKLKVKGAVTKHLYEGDFTVRVPGTREMGLIGVELAKLNGGVRLESLDRSTARLHNSIAFLKVAIVAAPNWFINTLDDVDEDGMDYGLDTDDINVPIEIFKLANEAVEGWHQALKGQPKDEPVS